VNTISKEAIDEARRLLENSHRVGASGIAAALQKHMDATARQAEHTAHYVREAHEQRQRVRELEATIDAMGKEQAATLGELGAVWAGKFELITEIRDWNEDSGDILHDSLEAILAKHEPP
jgi:hypothetical protein